MIILVMDTEHYEFIAAGNSEKEAGHALESALQYHGEACDLPKEWWKGHYDVRVIRIGSGECLRDGQLLYRKGAK